MQKKFNFFSVSRAFIWRKVFGIPAETFLSGGPPSENV
jgi:hypothetical protein